METTLEEDQRADLLDKEFKMMVINILKELKEDVEKSRKQCLEKEKKKGNTNKKIESHQISQKFGELKSKKINMKNLLGGFKGSFE